MAVSARSLRREHRFAARRSLPPDKRTCPFHDSGKTSVPALRLPPPLELSFHREQYPSSTARLLRRSPTHRDGSIGNTSAVFRCSHPKPQWKTNTNSDLVVRRQSIEPPVDQSARKSIPVVHRQLLLPSWPAIQPSSNCPSAMFDNRVRLDAGSCGMSRPACPCGDPKRGHP